jgi:hypothetical protein
MSTIRTKFDRKESHLQRNLLINKVMFLNPEGFGHIKSNVSTFRLSHKYKKIR